MTQQIKETLAVLDTEVAAIGLALQSAQDEVTTQKAIADARVADITTQLAASAAAMAKAQAELDAKALLIKKMSRYLKAPGSYLPDDDTTGCVDESVLVDVTIPMTYTGAFGVLVISNKRFLNTVDIKGAWIDFVNCAFHGPMNPTRETVWLRWDTVHHVRFIDCEFRPRSVNDKCGNINGRGFTAKNCRFRNGIDGMTICPADNQTAADVVLDSSYVTKLAYFNPSTTHSDGQTHSDALTIIGGNVTLIFNRIEGTIDPVIGTGFVSGKHPFYPNPVSMSAIMFNERTVGSVVQLPSKIQIRNNWFRGGYVCLNGRGLPKSFLVAGDSVVENNWFMTDQGYGRGQVAVFLKSCVGIAFRNNYQWIAADPLSTYVPLNVLTSV